MIKNAIKSAYRTSMDMLPDEMALKLIYYKNFRKWPNFSNPRLLSEKINWRKVHERDPRFTVFSDKISAKKKSEN